MDTTPNRPEIVAELSALFKRYEQALMDKDVDVLDASFWNSPHTIRYALKDNGYGFDAIHASRVAATPGGTKGEWIRHEILTLGTDVATINLEYRPKGRDGMIGRQSQTWVRFPDLGWKIVSAHVSLLPEGGW